MSLRPQDPLKPTLLLVFALWLCHFASGLTITYFGEDKCTTPLPSPFQGAPNPLVAPLNQCTKCFEVIAIQAPLIVAAIVTFFFRLVQDGPTKLYIKPTICTSTYPYPIYTYVDANCSVTHLDPHSFIIGACVTQGTPWGCSSFMITCAPAAAVELCCAVVAIAWIFIFL